MRYTKRRLNDSTAHAWLITPGSSIANGCPVADKKRYAETSSLPGAACRTANRSRNCPRIMNGASGKVSEYCSGKGVRLAQKLKVGPCISVVIQLFEAEVGPTSGPTWCLSHLQREAAMQAEADREVRRVPLDAALGRLPPGLGRHCPRVILQPARGQRGRNLPPYRVGRRRLGVDVEVILMSPCIFCTENH
jgi:hypothetical protein